MSEASGRLYHCALCRCQVVICSHCDRGNIYCGSRCSGQTRLARQKLASQRYQSSLRGRQKNAARQASYRIRRIEKVTHQGSHPLPPSDLLSPPPEGSGDSVIPKVKEMDSCFFCKKRLRFGLRMDFLNRDTRRIVISGPAFPSGP
jgi:hypothetical protein